MDDQQPNIVQPTASAGEPVNPIQPTTPASPATEAPVSSQSDQLPTNPTSEQSQTQVDSPIPISSNTSQPAPVTIGTPSGAGKKILLVEDDDALANVYQTRLESEGFQTQRVANGEEALQSVLQYKPDLIVLDVMMPKVSGFDVLDILRNTPDTSAIKIVMLTALSQDADKERAKSLGVNEYLVKSQVVIADVVERIKHQLGLN